MARTVKKTARVGRRTPGRPRRDQTRISSKHQVTIPANAFEAAHLRPGDNLHVVAQGSGQVLLTRIDALIDRYAGCLRTGGGLRTSVEALREEWR